MYVEICMFALCVFKSIKCIMLYALFCICFSSFKKSPTSFPVYAMRYTLSYLILIHKTCVMFNCLNLLPPSLNHTPMDISVVCIFFLSIKINATSILVHA